MDIMLINIICIEKQALAMLDTTIQKLILHSDDCPRLRLGERARSAHQPDEPK
jgi:hypothetical protein